MLRFGATFDLNYCLTSYFFTPYSRVLLEKQNGFLPGQVIPRILWNPKVHYRIHNSPPPVPIRSQLHPVHVPTSHFLKVHFNIIFPSTPGSSKWFFLSRSQRKPCIHHSCSHMSHMSRPPHSTRFDHPNNTG